MITNTENFQKTFCNHLLGCEWFSIGCEVIQIFEDMNTEPLLEILGIDEHAKTKRTDRTREGVQKFFDIKIKELKTMASAEVVTNKEKLIKACAGNGLSNKQVVRVNKYLMTEDFNDDKDTFALFR